jgi:hypothetical protein
MQPEGPIVVKVLNLRNQEQRQKLHSQRWTVMLRGVSANSKSLVIWLRKLTSISAQCEAAQKAAPIQTFNLENLGPDPAEPDFDLICMA